MLVKAGKRKILGINLENFFNLISAIIWITVVSITLLRSVHMPDLWPATQARYSCFSLVRRFYILLQRLVF